MRTHELSKALSSLSKVLKAGPDVEIEDWSILSGLKNFKSNKGALVDEGDIPSALYTLVTLNDVSKSQWLNLMVDFGIDVDIRPRDGNRDVVNKILSYLAVNPDARNRLLKSSSRKNVTESSELANALNLLLK